MRVRHRRRYVYALKSNTANHDNHKRSIDHFTVVCSVAWPVNHVLMLTGCIYMTKAEHEKSNVTSSLAALQKARSQSRQRLNSLVLGFLSFSSNILHALKPDT